MLTAAERTGLIGQKLADKAAAFFCSRTCLGYHVLFMEFENKMCNLSSFNGSGNLYCKSKSGRDDNPYGSPENGKFRVLLPGGVEVH